MSFWSRVRLAAMLLSLWGCSSLPSETPLGVGPQALAEARLEARNEERARARVESGDVETDETVEVEAASSETSEVSDAGADSMRAESAEPGEADAALDSAVADAGAHAIADFAGYYLGFDITVMRIDGLPAREEEDPNAKLSIEQKGSELSIEIINSLNDEPLCELQAVVKDGATHEAELGPDQKCFGDPSGVLDITIQSGSVSVKGEKLSLKLAGKIEVSLGGEQRTGSLDYDFKGTRR